MANVGVLGGLTKFFEGFLFMVCCRTYFEWFGWGGIPYYIYSPLAELLVNGVVMVK